ncbi:MAG: periplasmic heavy metal sensor [Alphaproteobacteria bacterium]|nr:periplasmic heavy metal sensor [Alphaproteobacteria bacterium]MBV9694238.1 periplasmic heavy metal sensor [Alphaproteobacteria bacterium]
MISKKLLLSAAFALMASAASPALAQEMGGMGHPHQMGEMHGGHSAFMMLLHSANLTPEQRAQVGQILTAHHSQTTAMHRQLQDLHEKIADKILGSGTVTSADLKPLVDQASRLEAKLNENMADTAVAIRNLLTADQVKHLAEVHAKLRAIHSQVQSLMGAGGAMPDDQEN